MRLISIFDREDGSVWKLYFFTDKNGNKDGMFVPVKPWSLEWIKFKISKWRFFL